MTTTMDSPMDTLPPDIAASWQRAQSAGLHPETPLDAQLRDVDWQSRLLVAAAPVLDELSVQLEDTTLCVLLADHESRLVDHRYTDHRVETVLGRIGIVPGVRLTEEVSGTNSVATCYETREPVFVNGSQHYLHSLKQFSCYGHPIRHPVTHRLEGVLDMTGVMPAAHPLFAPLVQHAVRDIEARLMTGSGQAERKLMAAFRAAAHARSCAIVVLGDDVVLSNSLALDMMDGADHALLRGLTPGPSSRSIVHELTLASGQQVRA
ncbi:MAG: sigma-54-dependent Fis family transcriptional regulator, partial [Thermocrispum sp.]